jgi:hypothetical protein
VEGLSKRKEKKKIKGQKERSGEKKKVFDLILQNRLE